MKRIAFGLVVGAMLVTDVRAMPVTFANRQNVNILQAAGISITASLGAAPTSLAYRTDYEAGYWENSGTGPGSGVKTSLTFDLGAVRNVKAIRTFDYYNAYLTTANTVETSPTGLAGSWTTVPSGTAVASMTSTVTLNSAVDARYVRLTGDTYQNASNRWVLEQVMIYGDTGAALDPGASMNLVSSTGFSGGGAVTIAQTGGSIVGNLADMANGNPASPLTRRVIYNIGANDFVTVNFNQMIDMAQVGFCAQAGHVDTSTTFHFQLWGAADGTNFTQLLLDRTGGVVSGANLFTLPSTFSGMALKYLVLNSNTADLRYNDFMVFQQVPEPAVALMLCLGGAALLRRRTR